MLEKLCSAVEESEGEVDEHLKEEITEHFQPLEKEFQWYFPHLTEEEAALVRNSFSASVNVASIPNELQGEFLDLRNDPSAHDLFNEKLLIRFCCAMYHIQMSPCLPFKCYFHLPHLCENGFSTLLHIRTKGRNGLNVDNDMRLALTNTQPQISKLVAQMQPITLNQLFPTCGLVM